MAPREKAHRKASKEEARGRRILELSKRAYAKTRRFLEVSTPQLLRPARTFLLAIMTEAHAGEYLSPVWNG